MQRLFTSGVRSVSSEFEYDPEISREINFRRWREVNSDERENYGLKPYTTREARELFEQLYDLFDKIPSKK